MTSEKRTYKRSKLIFFPDEGKIDLQLSSGKIRHNVGYKGANGYIYIRVNYKLELEHRLIWQHVNGPIEPGFVIDHINGDRTDNRISNLRLVTQSENNQNQHRARLDNISSGRKGVSYDKRRGMWVAQLQINGRHIWLGYWNTIEQAEIAYSKGAAVYHTCNPHAEDA